MLHLFTNTLCKYPSNNYDEISVKQLCILVAIQFPHQLFVFSICNRLTLVEVKYFPPRLTFDGLK